MGVVFPIVKRHASGRFERLGTGFLIDLDGTFMTACHVLDVPCAENEAIVAGLWGDRIVSIDNVRLSQDLDIAVARLRAVSRLRPFVLSRQAAPGIDVTTLEWSNVEWPQIRQSIRRGNVVSVFPCPPKFARRQAYCLELSLPAPEGSSGAPVIAEDGNAVGMIVGHNDLELGAYRLPIGVAIAGVHLLDFGREQGLELRLFMTANLENVFQGARDAGLHDALTEAAISFGRIVHRLEVTAVEPLTLEARIEDVTVEPAEPGSSGDPILMQCIRFTVEVVATVRGWNSAEHRPGTFYGPTEVQARIRGTAYVGPGDGPLLYMQPPVIESIECDSPSGYRAWPRLGAGA